MEVRREIGLALLRVFVIGFALSLLVAVILAALGKAGAARLGGLAAGFGVGMLNFCLLAKTIVKIGASDGIDTAMAKRLLRRSYILRMLLLMLLSVAAISLHAHPLYYALGVLLYSFAARLKRR